MRTFGAVPFLLGLGGIALLAIVPSRPINAEPSRWSSGRAAYIENCGGCHGFNGDSAPAAIPVLKNRVGYFLCTDEGRRYLVRLPNVAHSRLQAPQDLADLLNYVVFIIGGTSVPPAAKPYTANEAGEWRKDALTTVSLEEERGRIVEQMISVCHVPAELREFYPGQIPSFEK